MADCLPTFRQSFSRANMEQTVQTSLLVAQKQVIEEITKARKKCAIVGRNADRLLTDKKPFNIFLCVEKDAKIRRCMERADKSENLTQKD